MKEEIIVERRAKLVTFSYLKVFLIAAVAPAIHGCTSGAAIQPDRSVFGLDSQYQRYSYSYSIEQTFEAALSVFEDAGYSIDVADRATGQISGMRGSSGDSLSRSDKDLKFYALVLPRGSGSEVAIKIVQVLKSGPLRNNRA